MTPIEQADPPGNESRPCGANRGNYDEGTWQCPSCREDMDIAQQVACGCGYLVCQPCWQIAGNFGGACPSCGLPPDADKSRQQHRLVCRGDRSTSSSGGSTSSTSTSGRSDTPQEPEENHVPGGGGDGGGLVRQQCQDGELQLHRDQQLRQDPARPGSEQRQQPQQSVFIRGADRRALQNLRVIRRTLVYAIGLSPNFAQVNTLKQPEYFGQYGDITKLVINHHQGVSPDDPRYGSASAYITFRRQEDAWAAICSVDGFRLMGRTIRASFGTTKYCNSFLRNLPCNNPDCLYLHELGDEGDRFTKDEVQLGLARHGSSFAFKEEVLGDRSGSSGHPRGSGGGADPGRATASNPVLPPPCPTTPPSHGFELGAGGGGNGNAGMSGFAAGRGPASPPYALPGAYRPVLGPDHHGGAALVGGLPSGVDGRWVGVQPGSPLPLGPDGRPRPRRRRGQRGRRGGGGGGSGAIPGSCCGGSVTAGDRCIAANGAQADAFTGRPTYDADESFVYGPRGARLPVVPVDSCQGGVSRSGSSGGEGRTPPGHLPSAYLFQNERVGAYGQASNNTSLDSASGRSRPTDPACLTPLMRASTPSSPFLPASDRAPPSTARLNMERSDLGAGGGGGDVYRPVSKAMAHTWSGSDRSSGSNSCRSSGGGGGGGAYSGGGNGRGYWGMERGSPLNTSETLTNTPSIEPSPSDGSSQLSFFGLAGASPQGVWNPPSLGDATGVVRGKKDQVSDAGQGPSGTAAPGASTAYANHHRHVQMRPTAAFFGVGERGQQGSLGRQQTKQQQHQQQHFRGGSRGGGGGDLSSISELRQSDRHDRSHSLDLGLKQQYHHQQLHQQEEGERQDGRQRRPHWYEGGVEHGSIAAAQQQQQQLQLQQRQQYFENDHVEARNDHRTKSSLLDERNSYAGGAGIRQSPSLPPGLSASDGVSGTGSRDPDDLSFVSESFAALAWDDSSTTAASWDGFSTSPSAGSGARSGSGGGESREAFSRGEGMGIWAGPGLAGPESLAASQAEASQWRRATPRLFA